MNDRINPLASVLSGDFLRKAFLIHTNRETWKNYSEWEGAGFIWQKVNLSC